MSRPSEPTASPGLVDSIVQWLGRVFLMALLLATPWMNGFILWEWQYWLFLSMPIALGLVGLTALLRRDYRIPVGTWLLLGFALLGTIQATPLFSLQPSAMQPMAIRIQQWFHGKNATLHSSLLSSEMQLVTSTKERTPPQNGPATSDSPSHDLPTKLAISADPLHTRTAVGTLCLAAIVAWLSSLVWRQRTHDPILLGTLCGLGVILACLFFFEATAVTIPEWLKQNGKVNVGTFRSKNVAAAYWLIGLSAGIGMLVHRMQGAKSRLSKDKVVYPIPMWIRELQRIGESIKTFDVVLMTATLLIAVAVVGSLSRGATLGAAVALGFLWITRGKGKMQTTHLILGSILTVTLVASLAYLDLDSQTSERFGDLLQDQGSQSGRLFVWWGAVRACLYYLSTGCGLGNFGFGLLPFYESRADLWFFYAESFWGHVLAEFGVWGILGLCAFMIALIKLWRNTRQSSRPVSIAFAFLAVSSVTHGLVDFCMIVPAVFLPFMTLWGAAEMGRSGVSREGSASSTTPASTKQRPWLALIPFLLLAFLVVDSIRAIQISRDIERFDTVVEALSNGGEEAKQTARSTYETYANRKYDDAQYERLLGLVQSIAWRQEYIAFQKAQTQQNIRWAQTSPLLIRLAWLRVHKSDPQKAEMLIGGLAAKAELERIHRHYENAVKLNPMDWRSVLGAVTFDLEGTPESQIARLHRWIPLANNSPVKLMEAGLLLIELGDLDTGATLCNRAVLLSSALSVQILGIVASQLNDEQMHRIQFPDDRRVLTKATSVFVDAQYPSTSDRIWGQLTKTLEGSPEATWDYWFLLSQCRKRSHDIEKEIHCLQRALDYKNDYVPAIARLGQCYLEGGESQKAREVIEQGLRIAPKNPGLESLLQLIPVE